MNSLIFVFTIISAIVGVCVVECAPLYGISEKVQLISINPSSFNTTKIGKPIQHELQAQNLASVDKKNGIYYFIGAYLAHNVSQLVGLSLQSGETVFTYDLPFLIDAFVGSGQYVTVDPHTGQVIAIGFFQNDGVYHILKIDPVSKSHKVIGNFSTSAIVEGAFAAYDGSNDIVWIENVPVGNDSVFIEGYDAYSGNLIHSLENPLIAETLAWDPVTGLMFGIGLQEGKNKSLERTFLSLDGKTGEFKFIAPLAGYSIISGSSSTLDPEERVLVAFLSTDTNYKSFYLVNVNIDSGKIINAPLACAKDAACPWSIEFA